MRRFEMTLLLEDYRIACNLLTERIDGLNECARFAKDIPERNMISRRIRILREERLDLMRTMDNIRGYCS